VAFSHRDRRIHRFLWRTLAVAAGGFTLLGALVLYGPTEALALAGLLGLATLGAATMVVGERAVAEYERDLRTVRTGGPSSGLVRVEVASEVGLERSVGLPSRSSPHSRRAPSSGEGLAGRSTP
jgi:hypothetical protein